MSYTPTEWKAGDTVTSAKLNKLEQGVVSAGSGILLVHNVNGTFDKTWQEIHDAGVAIVIVNGDGYSVSLLTYSIWENDGTYGVQVYDPDVPGMDDFICASASGYPSNRAE